MKKAIFLTIFNLSTSSILLGQTSTETFETEINSSTQFTDNRVTFNIISHQGSFAIQAKFPGTG